ncbi:MarR family winged helix-turn-helix transcriptional regulator [Asticcacaulis tiandongensis]|uniref:MarR family winged helix-turn-helix transcriptional regulator n=1 Tax=Asticcacaulis tiandongensis TaxID=2565365 RepID=UPI00112ACD55|nr:MarR family transcriptional regulator [Asticcacaulis tiandongensis]
MDQPITSAALRAIRRVLRAADQGGRKLASVTGLTPSQLLVLQEIEQRGETLPSAVAASLQFGQATVTNIVDRLEAAKLVTRERGTSDKRQVVLRITEQGRAVLENAPDLLHKRFKIGFNQLPAWEQAMILAGLERLGELLDAGEIDAAPLIDSGVIDRDLAPELRRQDRDTNR